MMKLDGYIKNISKNENSIKSKYPKEYSLIIKYNNEFNIPWVQKLYNYIYNINTVRICNNDNCNNPVKFYRFSTGYRKYCSNKCHLTSNEIKIKRKKTKLKKYGDENFNNRKKFKETNLKRYGTEIPLKNLFILEKFKETNLKRYGAETPLLNKDINIKIKQTKLEKYGDENFNNREGAKLTTQEKYGVDHIMHISNIKEKIKQTNLKRYGVENVFQNKDIIENILNKRKNTYQNKWSKILNIKYNDISLNKSFVVITSYCKNHPIGFEITKSLLIDRIKYGVKNICTICNPISEQSSIKENEIKDWLKNDLKLNIIENDREILNGKELDIYLPDFNLGIEFNGLYWHSELFKSKNYHLDKTELALSKGIQLIHIFEDEWIYKSDIVKSIIKAKLGLIKNKIFGRKTELKEITSKESREFLNNNHIQGNVNASIRIGLFYDNELVSLMTFGKTRKSMKSKELSYDLNRFCNKLNTSVIGGASKLLKYFKSRYDHDEIISFADRRWSNGDLYEKLNFIKNKINKPNYSVFKNNELKRHHRFNFRKEILIKMGGNPNKTESEILIEFGLYKIYDCGNIKFKYSIY